MAVFSKLTSKSQITIPKKVRLSMGLREGDLICFEPDGSGSYRMTRHRTKANAQGILQPFISKEEPTPTVEEMNNAVSRHMVEKAGATIPGGSA